MSRSGGTAAKRVVVIPGEGGSLVPTLLLPSSTWSEVVAPAAADAPRIGI